MNLKLDMLIVKVLLTFLLFIGSYLYGQQLPINQSLLKGPWAASWITCPETVQREYGVYHFRKVFNLDQSVKRFIIHVSADNRYRLFVNGRAVCSGPARGDLYNWYFETVDIAPYLKPDNNIIAATVWNMGADMPVAQVSNQTALVVQGDGETEKIVNTNNQWKVVKDTSYTACSTDNQARLGSYMVIGPGDQVEAKNYPWGWEMISFNDQDWLPAKAIGRATPVGYGTDNLWTLSPRTIPLMEETHQQIPVLRRSSGIKADEGFLTGKRSLIIPAATKVSILLDQTHNTVAYPELIVSGGMKSTVKLTYAEALFLKGTKQKGNRNDIDGKEIKGNYDIFLPDGGENRLFRPLWMRTYRYLQLDITTRDEPLILNNIYGMYTGYPFKENAGFSSDDVSLQKIWEVGWRTARLCAGETYFDCPYYEQLQYEGDTRIQALISLYVSGDDRLMRKAITDFNNSRVPEGLTQGRYPSNRLQIIPPFSLIWVSMIHDYWMHRKDDTYISSFLSGIQGVLNWYEQQLDQDKQMLGPMKWWNFVDYTQVFPSGVPDGAIHGNSSVLTLQYVYSLQQAAELFEYFGKKSESAHYKAIAKKLSSNTYRLCFDAGKQALANTPEKQTFSQHAGIMGILSESIPLANRKEAMKRLLKDSTLGPVTYYWRFYLTQALKKAGLADLYYSQLGAWRSMLDLGLSTFAEKPEPARSDCHAWSASPNYDFLATICGIMPDAPGFKKILIKPAFGELKVISGNMPHPEGQIILSLAKENGNKLRGEITLPQHTTGKLIWQDKKIRLKSGKQTINL